MIQNATTCIVPLPSREAAHLTQVREAIAALPPIESSSLHFAAVTPITLARNGELPTHILIELNYDGALCDLAEELEGGWTGSRTLLELCGEGAESLFSLLSRTNRGSGSWYVALSGLSVTTIRAAAAVAAKARQQLAATGTRFDSAQDVLSQLRAHLHPHHEPRSFRVRHGDQLYALAKKALFASLLVPLWLLNGVMGGDAVPVQTHFRDILTLVGLLLTLPAIFKYVEARRLRRDGINRSPRDARPHSLMPEILGGTGLALLLLSSGSPTAALTFILAFVVIAVLFPGLPLIAASAGSPAEQPEELITRLMWISLAAILTLACIQIGLQQTVQGVASANSFAVLALRASSLMLLATTLGATGGMLALEHLQEGALKKTDILFALPAIAAAWLAAYVPSSFLLVPLALLPILLIAFVVYVVATARRAERAAKPFVAPGHEHLDALTGVEDRHGRKHNHITSVTVVDPARLVGLKAYLLFLKATLYWSTHSGTLGGVTTIHFARWILINEAGTNYLVFLTNYSGSFDGYLDEFINSSEMGLNLLWGPTFGFPRTYWGLFSGAAESERFKEFARASQVPTLYHYSAYPNLTVDEIEWNYKLNRALALEASDSTAAGLVSGFARDVPNHGGQS